MITFLSRFNVKPDKEAEFLDLVDKLTHATRENEPGCVYFSFYKRRDHAHGYAVFESFIDDDAEHTHMNAEHFKQFGMPMLECLDGEYVREYLDDVR